MSLRELLPPLWRALILGAALAIGVAVGCGDETADRRDALRGLDRRLLAAAYRNDVAAARDLIDAGADVDAKDDSEQSAYLIATARSATTLACSSSRSARGPTSTPGTATTAPV